MASKVNWNDGQIKAIEQRGKGIVVPAAAGSGKTAVLVERTIRQLADKDANIPADRLLVVTFTKAAAAQLREKLTNALAEKIKENPTNEWLAKQQTLLQMAKIMTINAFSLEFVKNNCHLLGLQSNIDILEDNEVKLIEADAVSQAIEELYAQSPDVIDKYISPICSNDREISETVLRLYHFLRSIPFSDIYMQKSIDRLFSENERDRYLDIIMQKAGYDLIRAERVLGKAKIIVSRLNIAHGIDVSLVSDSGHIDRLRNALESSDWDSVVKELHGYKFPSIKKGVGVREEKKYNGATSQLSDDNMLIGKIAKLREEYKGILQDEIFSAICLTKDRHRALFEQSGEIIKHLWELTKRTSEIISKEKAHRGGLDFADVELMTVSLLCKEQDGRIVRSELCEELVERKEYAAILIDEYQDTNNLQDLIFKSISDTEDISLAGKNMFIVGDIKQAIYGFRQTNPKLFAKSRADACDEANENQLCEIALKKNYRSRREIVDFTNFMFERLMSREIGGVDYTGTEMLSFGAPYDKEMRPAQLLKFEENEHIAVAMKIRSMLDSGAQVYDNGSYRSCIPSDFCVLTRTKGQNFLYAAAFNSVGLNISCSEIMGYLSSREIALMINLLKVLDNPMNDMALLSVLMSPLFMFSADEVATIKSKQKWNNRLYQLLLEASKGEYELDKTLTYKCTRTCEQIKLFRYFAATLSIEKLIRRLYNETDFYILSCTFSSASQSQANLRLLLDMALSYDANSFGGLAGFIRYIDSIIENNEDFTQASVVTEKSNAVNLMTMHKSKGLEFPFVFLCNLKSKFNKKDLSKKLLLDLDYGIGIKTIDKRLYAEQTTASHTVIEQQLRRSLVSEELRLLYVAITRAKEQLFIMLPSEISTTQQKRISDILLSASNSGILSSDSVAMADNMLDWVLASMAFHKDGEALLSGYGIEYTINSESLSDCSVEIKDTESASYLPKKQTVQGAVADPKVIKTLIDGFEKKPFDDGLSGFAKISVSEVVHGNDGGLTFFPQIPKLSEETANFSAARKGTLTHRFMEVCDFDLASLSVDAELSRLILLGHFSEAEARGIYVDALKKFFGGTFAKRMLSSGNILREKQFLVKLSDLKLSQEIFGEVADSQGMVQGIADCIFEEDDGYVLVDYKTDRVSELTELTARYSLQLLLYKAAFSLILDKPIKSSYIYSFYLSQGIEVKF